MLLKTDPISDIFLRTLWNYPILLYFSIWFFWCSFSSSFPVGSFFLPRNTLNPDYGLNYFGNFYLLVPLPISESKSSGKVSLPHTPTNFPELNSHKIWYPSSRNSIKIKLTQNTAKVSTVELSFNGWNSLLNMFWAIHLRVVLYICSEKNHQTQKEKKQWSFFFLKLLF